eukprot:scaffold59437_cov27-Tisochrysis_lutea.AAC.1
MGGPQLTHNSQLTQSRLISLFLSRSCSGAGSAIPSGCADALLCLTTDSFFFFVSFITFTRTASTSERNELSTPVHLADYFKPRTWSAIIVADPQRSTPQPKHCHIGELGMLSSTMRTHFHTGSIDALGAERALASLHLTHSGWLRPVERVGSVLKSSFHWGVA